MTESELRARLARLAVDDEIPPAVRAGFATALHQTLTAADLRALVTVGHDTLSGLVSADGAVHTISSIAFTSRQ